MIKIFNPNDRDFHSNGNICINPISCIEKKKKSLNGWYLEVKIDIKYKEYIKKDYLVVIKTKSSLNPQAFRIADDDNDSTIQYTDRFIIFKANHVAFDSKRYFLVDVRPTKLNAIAALEHINERTDQKSPFFVYSDINSISTAYFIRKNLLEAWEILEERYSGYFQIDNWNIKLMSSVGKETGEIIAYGQKLQGFQIFESWSNVVTKLCPTGSNGLMLDEIFLESDIQYDVPYTKTQQFPSDLPIEEQTEENLKKELKIKAQNYLNENKYPLISYEVTSDINQDLDIGDKAHIKHPLTDIKVEVVEYTFDHVQEKIISIVFGNFVRDVKSKFDTIKQNIIDQSEKLSVQEKTILHQTELINNLNKNGLVYIDDNEVLILDKVPKEQAKNVWRWGLGGFAFSSNGYEGPFSIAITQDGRINADFITTGKINTNLIEGYEQLVQKVTKTEESIENITTTTQESIGGNHLCINESLEANALEYIIYGKSKQESIPLIANPSEIKTIPSVRNLLKTDLLKFAGKGLNLEFEGSTVKINGTSTNQGTQTIKTKTKLKKGTYTISFSKLGGTLERKDSNDCQLFIQTSDGTTERLTNITGSRLENGENAKTTITLEEDKEIYLYFYYKIDLVFNNYEIGVQIEEGSIAHDYRPSGTYAKIRITGENQFFLKNPSCRGYSYDLPSNKTNYITVDSYDSNNLSFSITGNGYAYILSNIHYLKPNEEYILSYNRENTNYPTDSNTRYYIYDFDENGNYVLNQNSTDSDGDKQYLFTTNELGMVAFAWGGDNKCSGASSIISNIMITEKVNETEEVENIEYEPSKENEVLIDLNKPNLFNKNDYGFVQNANFDSTGLIKNDSVFDLLYFKLSKGTYKIFNFIENDYLVISQTSEIPNIGIQGNGRFVKYSDTCMYTMNSDGYLVIRANRETAVLIDQLVESLKVKEGYEDYYELCTDDVLKVEDNNVELHKKIEKIVLDGSESFTLHSRGVFYSSNNILSDAKSPINIDTIPNIMCTHFQVNTYNDVWFNGVDNSITISSDKTSNPRIRCSQYSTVAEFKAYLKEQYDVGTPVTIYYELAEPQDILLPNVDIPLFDGINHVQLVDNIETDTSIKFLRETLLSNDYVVQPQLKETNKNLANTTDKVNQNSSDINATNTNLNNNYFNKNQINEMQTTTNQNITQVRNTVETLTTSTEYKINAINETITNGVPLVKTTSTSFGEDGWSMEKTGEEMSSQWNWQGFEVVKDKGKPTEETTLLANSNGVVMNNAETKKRYIQRPIMIEKGTSISDGESVGLCHYYIGE